MNGKEITELVQKVLRKERIALVRQAHREIQKVPHGHRGPFRAAWAARIGISITQLDHQILRYCGRQRKLRCDAGIKKNTEARGAK